MLLLHRGGTQWLNRKAISLEALIISRFKENNTRVPSNNVEVSEVELSAVLDRYSPITIPCTYDGCVHLESNVQVTT